MYVLPAAVGTKARVGILRAPSRRDEVKRHQRSDDTERDLRVAHDRYDPVGDLEGRLLLGVLSPC